MTEPIVPTGTNPTYEALKSKISGSKMRRIVITYDIASSEDSRQDEAYKKLYDKLNDLQAIHICQSTWIFETNKVFNDIFHDFVEVVNKDDRLHIAEMSRSKTYNPIELIPDS